MSTTFEAALTWEDELLAFLPTTPGVRREMRLEERGEGFGLLEPDALGWTLCIPDGAEAEVSVDEAPIDLRSLRFDASGERRLRVCAGLRARVSLGQFRFELHPSRAAS